jgi:2,4-didehydro-3-deoxy-L-rhamnonate hydrolase
VRVHNWFFMKLCRFGPAGFERPGMVDVEGNIRDLSAYVDDVTPGELGPNVLEELAALDPVLLPRVDDNLRYGAPVSGSRQFSVIGQNYSDNAAQGNLPLPSEPVILMKPTGCVQGPNHPIVIPRGSEKTDWEVELCVVMGRPAAYIEEADALNYIAGYCATNDLAERAYQLERGGTWDKGKCCPTFGPVGPWLVTADEIGDVQGLSMWSDVNGRRMQTGNKRNMIFPVATLISYLCECMTLEPGDLIATGTPAGIGLFQKPHPRYLRPGDVVTLGVERLGEQRQEVVAWTREAAAV